MKTARLWVGEACTGRYLLLLSRSTDILRTVLVTENWLLLPLLLLDGIDDGRRLLTTTRMIQCTMCILL